MLTARLAAAHGRSEARLVANGTTGLYLALAAAGLKGRRVAIPNGVCFNVPLAVILSGNEPVYVDIEPRTLGLDAAQLDAHGDIAAVIAVHAYGTICEIEQIAEWSRRRGALLVEDLAVAQGATRDGRPAGSWGDVAVMSFGRGKIIDVGDGGAVLSNDAVLLGEIDRIGATLPIAGDAVRALGDAVGTRHTALYNEGYGAGLDRDAASFRAQAIAAGAAFVRGTDLAFEQAVMQQMDRLDANIERRRQSSERLLKTLAPFESARAVTCVRQPEDAVPWRFNLLIESGRDTVLKSLLASRARVSSWYPPVDQFFESRRVSGVDTPVCDRIGDTILNLWVNDEVDSSYLDEMAGRVTAMAGAAQ